MGVMAWRGLTWLNGWDRSRGNLVPNLIPDSSVQALIDAMKAHLAGAADGHSDE